MNNDFLDSDILFLSSCLNSYVSTKLIKELSFLSFKDIKNIYLYIHSDGGDYDSACAILDKMDAVKSLGIQIYTIGTGYVGSGATLILSNGSPECRFATKNTVIMAHGVYGGASNSDTVEKQSANADFYKKHQSTVLKQFAKNCDQDDDFIEEVKGEITLTAKQALDYGIVDGIWSTKEERKIRRHARSARNRKIVEQSG